MHLGHLALPLLTANGLRPPTNVSVPHNPSLNAQVFCYQQRPPQTPQRATTTYHDCMQLGRRIIMTGKPHAQIDFSRDDQVGVEVPYRLVHRTCVFEVDIDPEQTREEYWAASMWEIANAAIEILPPCVVQPPHLGGLTKVGRDNVLDFKLYGQALPRDTA